MNAPGGTGKTFLISLILVTVHARLDVLVTVDSSGIPATLLEGCCMAHSVLKWPLNLQTIEQLTYNIAKHSAMAKVFFSQTRIGST